MSAVGMLAEVEQGRPSAIGDVCKIFRADRDLVEAEVRERMSGNLCRCAAYQNMMSAVLEVASNTRSESLR